ncbi:MAG: deoxyhypusine synthase [Candidatus Woesearchaeota archaeon]|jgi:deoxyhypusine synthase|nr:deoxyhypusine synthase [Candidatus Woesearchaeota archaeon]MDP7457911.1 deoxyhypusine synthase [Candidatus Woesearchaeota archaeon]
MKHVSDLLWEKNTNIKTLMEKFKDVGFQSIELNKALDVVLKMKREGAKIYLTFTSNMVTSGLRGLFAQLIKLGLVDIVVTTVGAIEEDIMKAHNEQFIVGKFASDDVELYEKGVNRVGNLYITNESYGKFENIMSEYLKKAYEKQKRWPVNELFTEFGEYLQDKNSILYQATKNNVPIYCPAVTDGALGFHLYMFQQKHDDFIIDVVKDFKSILLSTSQDEKKGVISLGGSVSKHHAIFACLLNGGLDYAVYLTTASPTSGSMSGATTEEAKSWGKVKDDSDVATVKGDVTITFPLLIMAALDKLSDEGLVKGE